MVFNLHLEECTFTDGLGGHTIFPAVGETPIEDVIVSAIQQWADKKHIDEKVPLSLGIDQQLPEEIAQYEDWRQLSPWGIYTFVHIGEKALSQHISPYDPDNQPLIDQIRVACDFMKDVHRALRTAIFEEFVPDYADNKSQHPDPQRMPIKECLEYAQKQASTEKRPSNKVDSPKEILGHILKGGYPGELYIEDIIEKVVERLYSNVRQVIHS